MGLHRTLKCLHSKWNNKHIENTPDRMGEIWQTMGQSTSSGLEGHRGLHYRKWILWPSVALGTLHTVTCMLESSEHPECLAWNYGKPSSCYRVYRAVKSRWSRIISEAKDKYLKIHQTYKKSETEEIKQKKTYLRHIAEAEDKYLEMLQWYKNKNKEREN